MHDTFENSISVMKSNKVRNMYITAALIALSLLVSLGVLFVLRQQGITMAGNADCGIVEHTHGDDCYEKSLACDITEEGHSHTEECYEQICICTQEAHVHTAMCYSDANADVESQLDWQKMYADYDNEDKRDSFIGIAKAQIGYTESLRNYSVDESGNRKGYTRYGAWYGMPYNDWSAMLVSFCLNYAGFDSDIAPYNIGADTMMAQWQSAGIYETSENYEPVAGDLIFFNDNSVGIVTDINYDVLEVVKGDVDDTVALMTVMDYDDSISGYGILPAMSDEANTLDGEKKVATDDEIVIPECDCGNDGKPMSDHVATCARKNQISMLAADKTAQELYELRDMLSDDEYEYILEFLNENSDKFGDKSQKLEDLIKESAATDTIESKCDGARVSVTGRLPADAELSVYDAEYTKERIETVINPNIINSVRWYAVYDISILSGGRDYQPEQSVQVTVSLDELAVAEDELFCVAHLDDSGNILNSQYADVTNKTVTFTADGFSPYLFYTVDAEVEGGERILGTNWITQHTEEYFTYWEQFLTDEAAVMATTDTQPLKNGENPSDVQVDDYGGSTASSDGKVTVSKTIDGTELENVFDITLKVSTQENIESIYSEPDMAVVIVMDISNTMTDNFGDTTRYKAAVEAAEKFIDEFQEKTNGVSRIGYVAFNTDAHEIFELSTCSEVSEAIALKNTMRSKTGAIINASGYGAAHTRFTNIEAGLKMAEDMLATAPNHNKYIIFLSDGFPTTYISNGYKGYDTYTPSGTPGTDGVFYDYLRGFHCDYGTSYSDKAAIRARVAAERIKASGTTIFAVGVDVGGQKISKFERSNNDFSVIDRTSSSYEIGGASDTSAYMSWLKTDIGSNYYYDSTNAGELENAYKDIFKKVLQIKEDASVADWTVSDPMPIIPDDNIEFIGFYDKTNTLVAGNLTGAHSENAENTAVYALEGSKLTWDLKDSGYTTTSDGSGQTTYHYELVYRVRLQNENDGFVERTIYDTNAPTTLSYRVVESIDGVLQFSDNREIDFKIPAVHGFLAELSFKKVDTLGKPISGAEFTLIHNTDVCDKCRGDGSSSVTVESAVAVSDEQGTVTFTRIPSGHIYTLMETKVPAHFVSDGSTYTVTVAYDKITVEARDKAGEVIEWGGTITNIPITFELPATGGNGVRAYVIVGVLLIAAALTFGCIYLVKPKRRC